MSLSRTAPISRKRKKPRRTSPRCEIRGCKRRVAEDGVCKTHLLARQDRAAREVVMERDERTCRRCGTGEFPQWAHVYSRRYRAIRHDPLNAMVLCRNCHAWQTHNPLEGEEFFRSVLGEDTMTALRRKALGLEDE